MRPIRLTLILAAGVLALCGIDRAPGQCPNCAAPALAPARTSEAAGYWWRTVDDEEIALYRGNAYLGNYRFADGLYFARLPGGGGFESEASEPPVAPPIEAGKRKCACSAGCKCKAKKCTCTSAKRCNPDCKCAKVIGGADGADPFPGGVDMTRISPTERITISGKEVTREEYQQELEKDAPIGKPDTAIPDDSKKNSLTVMGGTAEQRQKALADLAAPKFTAWRESVLIQEYEADSPMLKCGFKVSAEHPTLYLQQPDGTVLARVDDYQGPQTWEAVRKTDPNYDASKDPDPTKPRPQPAPTPDDGGVGVGAILWLVGFLFFGVFLMFATAGLVLLVRWAMKPQSA